MPLIKVETVIHIVEQDRLPSATLVQELGEVAKLQMDGSESEDSAQAKPVEPIRRDFPKENEEIVVIARDSKGKPRAAAIAVVSTVIDGISVKRFKAKEPEDAAAVLETLEGAVLDKYSDEGKKPTVHITPFAEQNHEGAFAGKSSSGTHSYYGPGRILRLK